MGPYSCSKCQLPTDNDSHICDDCADDDDPEATPIVKADDPDAADLPEPDIGGES